MACQYGVYTCDRCGARAAVITNWPPQLRHGLHSKPLGTTHEPFRSQRVEQKYLLGASLAEEGASVQVSLRAW